MASFTSKIRLYKGLYRVKIVTETEGYWIVEALEDFNDCVDGEEIKVKKGERRIVSPDILIDEKDIIPQVKEHEYELKMEKKVKKLLEQEK